jgi:hypothetical protein
MKQTQHTNELIVLNNIAELPISAIPKLIPRGLQIARAEIRGPTLKLYFKAFFKPTFKIAQDVFGLPPVVRTCVCDWYLDENEVVQINDCGDEFARVLISEIGD